ncbi:tRNA lysidine(34) synthetase TilS [Devosia insulae DS-56]|uniref:tRNA(Ile)-lysidine synthase n=1 Tax=Devosia insulae DS-56 TaxID=1116389 RepID=A0A1E5XS35_9HYPH|nr:tRNA lysidine(34) synthetase TilS [Devosia insulae]OEO31411.1 tRNA lysidine(34) synthetase TilS [Devosia insulae DS-56]
MPGDVIDSEAIFAPLAEFRRVGLAVSGGPDSLALLLLAAEFAGRHAAHDRFVVYSVDHQLRPEAAGEVASVAAAARKLGLAAHTLRWDGPKPATGMQQAARTARYRLIADAMLADGADVLVTAHHLADQAETVLMRLAHGSGIEGLRGMDYLAEIGGLIVVRPLLGVDPADLASLVAASDLVPAQDPSNSDTDYERVRWRQMLPQLAALGLDAHRLSRFAGRMRDADQALADMAAMAATTLDPATGSSSMAHATLVKLPRAVAIRVVAKLLDQVGGWQKPHDLAPVEALADRLRLQPALKRTSLHGCLIGSDGVTITVVREAGRQAARQSRVRPDSSVTRN